LSEDIFKKRIKTYTISNKENIIESCWIYRESSGSGTNETKKLSEKIWEVEPTGILLKMIVKSIDKAQNIICISTFLISEHAIIDAMKRAASRGVRVYLLTSKARLEDEYEDDDEFNRRIKEEHIKLLNEFAGNILVRIAEHFHSKFILIDPNNSQNCRGFLLTSNLTHEALTRNKEIGIILNSKEVKELYLLFCYAFWRESEHELFEPGNFRPISRKENVNFLKLSEILYTTNNNSNLKDNISSLISNSNEDLIISSFGFEENHEITDLIINQIEKGRKVIILTRNRIKNMSTIEKFEKKGAEVYAFPWLHAKAILVKNENELDGIIFSANLQKNGLDKGFESGIKVFNEDALELEKILTNWFKNFPLILKTKVMLEDLMNKVIIFENNSFIEKEIKPIYEFDLGEIEAETIEQIENTRPKKFPEPRAKDILYHEIKYIWTIIPPQLPKNAVKIESNNNIQIFKLDKKKYILVKNKNELKIAQKLNEKIQGKIVIGL